MELNKTYNNLNDVLSRESRRQNQTYAEKVIKTTKNSVVSQITDTIIKETVSSTGHHTSSYLTMDIVKRFEYDPLTYFLS